MSRILKRPMFRKGGSSNKGIMTGLVDRKQYQFGSIDKEQIAKNVGVLEEVLRDYTPKTRLPIGEFGLNLASGMTLTDALRDPYKKFTRADDAREAAIKGGAAKLGIGKALEKPKDTRTAAVKNAMAIGLVPGTPEFNKFVQAATIKGGFNIEFGPDGKVKNISEGGSQSVRITEKANDIKSATFAMNNVASTMLKNLEGAKVGTVGGVINALDSVGAQLSQLAEVTGIKNNFVSEGTGEIDAYLKKNLGEGIFADAVQYGKIKSNAINLAYLMARVDEPGGRFTDRDIALKMEEIGIGSNPQKTAQILAAAVNLRNQNAANNYKLLTGEELTFENFDISNIFQKPKTKTSAKDEDKEPNYNPLGFDESRLSPRTP
jgi:hypothetical protein